MLASVLLLVVSPPRCDLSSPAGTTALIQTQQTVLAAVTEDARVSCQLTQTKDVVQVNWQKYFPVRDKFLASYHEVFGQTVSSDSRGKVEFAEADLQSSSIIIGNVTEQDDGCYHCVFNIFPDGAFTAKTCLQVYELHEPVLHIRDSDSSEKTLVSCSATARPAPTVTLRVLQQDLHLSEHSSVSVNNTNGTVTVTATALLSGLHDNSVQVGCAGRVLSASQVEVFMTIPEVKHTSADGEKHLQIYRNISMLYSHLICCCFTICFLFLKGQTLSPSRMMESPVGALFSTFSKDSKKGGYSELIFGT
uniref:Ig-like domain-containing protein n=1 Tax=Mola mola TaxID=94237 RepID=A0A3Q3WUN7_MOLML